MSHPHPEELPQQRRQAVPPSGVYNFNLSRLASSSVGDSETHLQRSHLSSLGLKTSKRKSG